MRFAIAFARAAALALLLAPAALAAPPRPTPAASLPDTPAGRTAGAYLRAFNASDPEAMKDFFAKHLSAAGLERRPMAERLQRSKEIKDEVRSLTLERVLGSEPGSVTLLARTGAGEWVELGIECEPGPEGNLAAVRIDQAEAPEQHLGGGSAAESPKARPSDRQSSPAAAGERLSGEALVQAIGAEVDRRARADEFSGTVLVAKDGEPVFQRACGLAERRFAVPNAMDTRFNLGSMDKLFTKIAIGQLAEQGKLSFDDTLGRYVSGLAPGVGSKVTLQHLLDMSSGMGDFFGDEFDAADKSRFRSNRDFLPLFAGKPLEFEPGTRRRYSNAGYITLGLVIEKITGQDYSDYVREHICRPAEMTSTDFYMADDPTPNLAMGYTRGWEGRRDPGGAERAPSGPRRENIYSRPARGSAAGGGYSTAGDLLRFANALAAGRLLGPAYTRWMLGGQRPAPGAALASGPARGAFGMAGGARGINAALEMDTETGYTIIVLSNDDPPSAESLARTLRGLMGRAPN